VSGNTISDFYFGDLQANSGVAISYSSSNNTIVNNDITKMSSHGILVNQSSNNFFIRNSILNSGDHAFTLQLCNHSIIDGNLVQSSGYEALKMDRSNFNSIFHNSFIDNNNHTTLTDSFSNIWNDGYPSGGNYWDNYNGTDSYNGPFQNETGSDSIGDTPYDVDDLNQDRYPLMKPNRLRWDVTGDGYVGIDDIVAVAEHFGQDPTHQTWESKYDVTGDNYIGIDDIVSIAEHFGESE
jgi:parallel beta-helix repeat protein